jgi:hypothetical protein
MPRRRAHRAVGWHLLAENERTRLDAQQWKAHSDELQAAGAAKAEEWAAKEEEAARQLGEAKVGDQGPRRGGAGPACARKAQRAKACY